MPDTTQSDRIEWPSGFDRTPAGEREPNRRFDTSLSAAFDQLEAELDRQDVDDFRYEFDAQSRKTDNRPYARANPDDPSFVLRWTKDGEQYAIACDAYTRLRDNVHGVGKYMREKGRMQRRPVTTGKSEFANARLPSGDEGDGGPVTRTTAHNILGVPPNASAEEIKDAYRTMAKATHPDNGGSQDDFNRVREAYETLLGGGE